MYEYFRVLKYTIHDTQNPRVSCIKISYLVDEVRTEREQNASVAIAS